MIAIISDIHNNLANLDKALEVCKNKGVDDIICCGDLASVETLDYLCENFGGDIFLAFGNMDDEHMPDYKKIGEYKNANIFADYGELDISGKKIAFVHYPDVAKRLAESGDYNFVFYGHTHKPWEEMIGDCKVLNPGCVAGDRFQATFALWNTKDDSFELVLLNNI